MSLADAKDVSVAAAAGAVLLELGSIFLFKKAKKTALKVEKIFSDFLFISNLT